MPILHKQKNQRGFTIIECLLTVVVISIGLTASMGILGNTISNSTNSLVVTNASFLAKQQLETIIAGKVNFGYDSIVAANYPDIQKNGFGIKTNISEINQENFGELKEDSGYKKIIVQVSGADQQVTVDTLLTR